MEKFQSGVTIISITISAIFSEDHMSIVENWEEKRDLITQMIEFGIYS